MKWRGLTTDLNAGSLDSLYLGEKLISKLIQNLKTLEFEITDRVATFILIFSRCTLNVFQFP